MNWLNIRTEFLRSPKVAGIEPASLATWLRVIAYCCEQENDGCISQGESWTDRQWMASCSVRLREIKKCSLITFSNGDVYVESYPSDKQAEVQAKREFGSRGGKAKALAQLQAQLQPEQAAQPQAELLRNGNGMEVEVEKEGKGSAATPTPFEIPDIDVFTEYMMERIGCTDSYARSKWVYFDEEGWMIRRKQIWNWKTLDQKLMVWMAEDIAKAKAQGRPDTITAPKRVELTDEERAEWKRRQEESDEAHFAETRAVFESFKEDRP